MKIQEFYDDVLDVLEERLRLYMVQKDKNGECFLYYPIMTRQSLIEEIEAEVESPFGDIDDFTKEEDDKLFGEVKESVLRLYDKILIERDKFRKRVFSSEEEIFDK